MTYTERPEHDYLTAEREQEIDAYYSMYYGEEYDLDPEDRRFIDWSDVEDADWSTVRYDLTYVPGADE